MRPEVRVGLRRHDRRESGPFDPVLREHETIEISVRHGTPVDRLERCLEAEVEVSVLLSVDREVLPLEEDRQIGRLLEFEDEDASLNCVGQACRHEHRIARPHHPRPKGAEQRLAVAVANPIAHLLLAHGVLEANPDLSPLRCLEHIPSFGLAM